MTSTLHFYVARLWDTRATASWFHPAKPVKYVVVGGQFWRRWKRRRRLGSEGFSCIHGKPSLWQSRHCFIALISEHNQLKFILVGWRWNESFGHHGFLLVYMLRNPWNCLTGGRNKLIDARQRSEEYVPCRFLHRNQFCVGSRLFSFFSPCFTLDCFPYHFIKSFIFELSKIFQIFQPIWSCRCIFSLIDQDMCILSLNSILGFGSHRDEFRRAAVSPCSSFDAWVFTHPQSSSVSGSSHKIVFAEAAVENFLMTFSCDLRE